MKQIRRKKSFINTKTEICCKVDVNFFLFDDPLGVRSSQTREKSSHCGLTTYGSRSAGDQKRIKAVLLKVRLHVYK